MTVQENSLVTCYCHYHHHLCGWNFHQDPPVPILCLHNLHHLQPEEACTHPYWRETFCLSPLPFSRNSNGKPQETCPHPHWRETLHLPAVHVPHHKEELFNETYHDCAQRLKMLARCEDLGSSEGISRKHLWSNVSNSNSYPSGTKIHQCLYCSYTSTLKCNLLRHERTHTGEKPFPCPHCNFRCSQNSDLKKHIRIHTGEKPFACSLCPYRSSRKESLRSHMRTHTTTVRN
ncbi:zinc finger protein 567-like [Penaeus chinensis]|uniref:zinc finger protein 567-like n=1 Tax=Penaeus chinensis TaxID=139456 RepID=UPI001FB5BF0A|nr:zinc finger protein 567-like [Penaeus chinensis]